MGQTARMADLDLQRLTWGATGESGVNTPDTAMPVALASQATPEVHSEITNAAEAGIFFLFANAAPEQGYRGITCFLIERDTPGFQVGKKEEPGHRQREYRPTRASVNSCWIDSLPPQVRGNEL